MVILAAEVLPPYGNVITLLYLNSRGTGHRCGRILLCNLAVFHFALHGSYHTGAAVLAGRPSCGNPFAHLGKDIPSGFRLHPLFPNLHCGLGHGKRLRRLLCGRKPNALHGFFLHRIYRHFSCPAALPPCHMAAFEGAVASLFPYIVRKGFPNGNNRVCGFVRMTIKKTAGTLFHLLIPSPRFLWFVLFVTAIIL